MPDWPQRNPVALLRVGLSLGIVLVIVVLLSRIPHVNSTTVALTLLLAVLGVATRWGLAEAIASSIGGVICLNYFFLPPIGAWTITDPQNWVAVGAFIIVSIVASQLSASAARRTEEATRGQHEMECLYRMSQSLMRMNAGTPVPQQIVCRIAETFSFPQVIFHDADSHTRYQAVPGSSSAEAAFSSQLVIVDGKQVGQLRLPRGQVSATAQLAIAHLAAMAIERARDQDTTQAKPVWQGEETQSTP